MARTLELYIKIKDDAASQQLAAICNDGFGYETWRVLYEASTVYAACITALKHPDDDSKYSHILLTTFYANLPLPYQEFFWAKLTGFFVLVALAAKDDPPFTMADLIPEQQQALAGVGAALEKCRAATSTDEFVKAQEEFRKATQALADAMDLDVQRKEKKEIEKTKFELFTAWVNKFDRAYLRGTPPVKEATSKHDIRLPPGRNEKSNFLNPGIAMASLPVDPGVLVLKD